MSEETVERIRQGYSAFNRGDFDAAVKESEISSRHGTKPSTRSTS
jgi:hypothetical protein